VTPEEMARRQEEALRKQLEEASKAPIDIAV